MMGNGMFFLCKVGNGNVWHVCFGIVSMIGVVNLCFMCMGNVWYVIIGYDRYGFGNGIIGNVW